MKYRVTFNFKNYVNCCDIVLFCDYFMVPEKESIGTKIYSVMDVSRSGFGCLHLFSEYFVRIYQNAWNCEHDEWDLRDIDRFYDYAFDVVNLNCFQTDK